MAGNDHNVADNFCYVWQKLAFRIVFCGSTIVGASTSGGAHLCSCLFWFYVFVNDAINEWLLRNLRRNGFRTYLRPTLFIYKKK